MEDQSEFIGGKIGADVGWQITLALYGSLSVCSLDVDRVLDVLCGLEGASLSRLVGAEADRVVIVVVMVVVGHADATV